MNENFAQIDTPALLVDRERLMENLQAMQDYADSQNVSLRPHTKTHKMPAVAKLQVAAGAGGITVAKVGEAEVMADNGLDDIFIANEIIGEIKLRRIRALCERGVKVAFGVDSPFGVLQAEKVFADATVPARVLIEIEVGENRSGIIEEADYLTLLDTLRGCEHVSFGGIFSHEGHCYSASSAEDCHRKFDESLERTLHFARIAEENGMKPETVSIGSTPSLLYHFDIMDGITEMRPGTYIFMDASMSSVIGTTEHCAATLLSTVISRPTSERVITDVGAKGLTAQTRPNGICGTVGMGTIKGFRDVYVNDVYDEHALIYNEAFREAVAVGDKVEIIPMHICPVCNLYDKALLVSHGAVVGELPILCRGRLQ